MKNILKYSLLILLYITFSLSSANLLAQNKKGAGADRKKAEQAKITLFEKTFRTKKLDSIGIYLNQFLKRYPAEPVESRFGSDALYGNIVQRMAEEKRWDKYEFYRTKLSNAASTELDYGTAVDLTKTGSNLNVAERLALRAIKEYEKDNAADLPKDGKPDSTFIKNEEERARGIFRRAYINGRPDSTLLNNEKIRKYGSMAGLYAEIAYHNKHYALGFPYALKAKDILGDKAEELYLKFLAQTAEPAVALSAIAARYNNGRINDDEFPQIVAELYKKAYPERNDFKAYYEGLRSQLIAANKTRISKERLSLPASDFSLLNLKGETVKLSDLKGKTVVIDFWATWCVFCKKGFPAMQKVINSYSDNDKVVFLFINTQESLSEEARKKQIADYIVNGKFNFNVLFDTRKSPEYDVVTAYKVDGLPTKFVISPDGKVAFKDVGYAGSDEKLINDLTAMIELTR